MQFVKYERCNGAFKGPGERMMYRADVTSVGDDKYDWVTDDFAISPSRDFR